MYAVSYYIGHRYVTILFSGMANVDFTPLKSLEEEEEQGLNTIKKQLFVDNESSDTSLRPSDSQKQPVLVYLRIRPKSQQQISEKDGDCLHCINNEIIAVAPKTSKSYKNNRYSKFPLSQ